MNKAERPINTLFLLTSLDGKISTGDNDERDVDKDFPQISGVKEGLSQYYELEKTTDRVSFNSGKVQAKVGVNERDLDSVEKTDLDFVVVDNQPHLTSQGSEYFAKKSKTFFLITTNKDHPAFAIKERYPNIEILYYEQSIDFEDVFLKLKRDFNIDRVTVQTGGSLNAHLLRQGFIDNVSLVIAPCFIGGTNTPSMIGGESLQTVEDLHLIKALSFIDCSPLNNSYLHVRYEVVNAF